VIVSRRIAASDRIVPNSAHEHDLLSCPLFGVQAGNRPFPFTPGRFLDGTFATISSWHWYNYVGF
jgi:hypothetical protein